MIFLTVGTQLPFDRFVKIIDQWAKEHPDTEVFAQIGNAKYLPKHMKYQCFLEESAYKRAFDKASVVLAHAAMGSIITSLIASKPVVVFPRKASLGEHRNEHQLATCRNLAGFKGCYLAYEEDQLLHILSSIKSLQGGCLAPYANEDLLSNIEQFIATCA